MGGDSIFEGLKLEVGEIKKLRALFHYFFGDLISLLPHVVYAATLEHISLSSFVSKVEETSWERRVGICPLQEEDIVSKLPF